MSTEAVSLPCSHDMHQLRSPLYDVPENQQIGAGWKFILSKGNQTVTGHDDFFKSVETRSQK